MPSSTQRLRKMPELLQALDSRIRQILSIKPMMYSRVKAFFNIGKAIINIVQYMAHTKLLNATQSQIINFEKGMINLMEDWGMHNRPTSNQIILCFFSIFLTHRHRKVRVHRKNTTPEFLFIVGSMRIRNLFYIYTLKHFP